MNIRFYALLLFVFILCTGCTAQKFTSKKPVMFASFEDFRFGPKGGVDLVWSTPKISDEISLRTALQKYDSFILDQTFVVVDRETAGTFDEKQMLKIPRHIFNAMKNKFGRWFKLVDIQTENTLRLSIAFTNTESSEPFFAETGGPLPVSSKSSTVTKIVADEHTKSGSVMVELLVSDARTNEPLIATIDKRFDSQDLGTMIGSQDVAEEAISSWVGRLWTTLLYWNWIQNRTAALL